eukprot:snap_masked-scaffold_34-processed-gene-2.4-mRNA-1 protein AED:1.00 eAED:1.00 QI:0/0/0/0/1/1/2/0/922
MKKFNNRIPNKFQALKKKKCTPQVGEDISVLYLEEVISNQLINEDQAGSQVPKIHSFKCEYLSGEEKREGKLNEVTGFMGLTARLQIQYIGGSTVDRFPNSVVAKFSSTSLIKRINLKNVALYLRECYFYTKFAPKMKDFGDGMLMVPDCYSVDYSSMAGTACLIFADAKQQAEPLLPGDEIKGATFAQTCSVALRYARFHSLHWSPNLLNLRQKHNDLSFYSTYCFTALPDNLLEVMFYDTFEELTRGDSLIKKLVPRKFYKYFGFLRDFFQMDNYREYKIYLESLPMTLVHGDARLENMMWPAIEVKQETSWRYYEDNKVQWWSIDWQTTTLGAGIYDVAYFVALSTNISDTDDSKDRKIVDIYVEELLRHSSAAREVKYNAAAWFQMYKLTMLQALLIPMVVMKNSSLGVTKVRDKCRAQKVRSVMLTRILAAIERLDADKLYYAHILKKEEKPQMFSYSCPFSQRSPELVEPRCDYVMASVPKSTLDDLNLYDRFFLNGYGYDATGDTIMFALALGVYPNRGVVDASFSVLRRGVQHNVRNRRCFEPSTDLAHLVVSLNEFNTYKLLGGAKEYAKTQSSAYSLKVGNIEIDIEEPLKRMKLNVSSPKVTCSLQLSALQSFQSTLLEPSFNMNVPGIGDMSYSRLTQFVCWKGAVNLIDDAYELQITEELNFVGIKDRSYGIRPHREKLSRLKAQLVSFPLTRMLLNSREYKNSFFWLWLPLNLGSGAVHFFVQQDMYGKDQNRDLQVLGSLGRILSSDKAGVVADENFVAIQHEEAEQLHFDCAEGKEFNFKLEYEHNSRHASRADIQIPIRRNGEPSVLYIRIRPLQKFFMSGVSYTHPSWGHGFKEFLKDSYSETAYDEIMCGLVDPTNQKYWHVQSLCKIELIIDGIVRKSCLSTMEQLSLGAHRPSGFRSISSP